MIIIRLACAFVIFSIGFVLFSLSMSILALMSEEIGELLKCIKDFFRKENNE